MRVCRSIAGLVLFVASLLVTVEPGSAQSVLKRFFGFGASRDWDADRRYPSYNRLGRMSPYGSRSRRYYDDYEEDLSTYRTMCVRVCDGFYFPINNAVRRERLYHDNRSCMQRCDGEARLFYYPTPGGSVESMVDLAGRNYSDLPNAFRYRKALVDGCSCKPKPWSAQEMARHQDYVAEDAQRTSEAEAEDTVERSAGADRISDEEFDPMPAPRSYTRRASPFGGRTPYSTWRNGWQPNSRSRYVWPRGPSARYR